MLIQANFRQTPKQSAYYQGDEIKPEGVIFLRYSNGYEKDVPITLDMLSGYDMNEIGDQTVTVSYRGFTLTYPIKVLEVSVQSIELDKTELNMNRGDTSVLSATITPENATNKTITSCGLIRHAHLPVEIPPWFYALVSGKLVKSENVYVKCPRCGKLCNKDCDRKPCGRNEVKHG